MKKTPAIVAQSIADAYKELTPQAFAMWVRLSSAKLTEINSKSKVATMLNCSITCFERKARELYKMKYITKHKIGTSNTHSDGFIILKKPLTTGPGFCKLK